MKRSMFVIGATFVLFTVLLIASVLTATTVIPMSVEELTTASDYVIQGTAVESRSAWNPQHTVIYTYTRFQVQQTLKGATEPVITVKQVGGSAGGYTMHVSGVHPWSNGESAMLFLRHSQDQDGTYVVAGLMQGDFRVRRSASGEMIVDNGLHLSTANTMVPESDVHSYNPGTKKLSEYTGAQLTLNELVSRVRTAANGGKELQ